MNALTSLPSCRRHHRVHFRYAIELPSRFHVSNALEGSVNIMRYGAGPNGVMRSLGQYMLGSGATFGYAEDDRVDMLYDLY